MFVKTRAGWRHRKKQEAHRKGEPGDTRRNHPAFLGHQLKELSCKAQQGTGKGGVWGFSWQRVGLTSLMKGLIRWTSKVNESATKAEEKEWEDGCSPLRADGKRVMKGCGGEVRFLVVNAATGVGVKGVGGRENTCETRRRIKRRLRAQVRLKTQPPTKKKVYACVCMWVVVGGWVVRGVLRNGYWRIGNAHTQETIGVGILPTLTVVAPVSLRLHTGALVVCVWREGGGVDGGWSFQKPADTCRKQTGRKTVATH